MPLNEKNNMTKTVANRWSSAKKRCFLPGLLSGKIILAYSSLFLLFSAFGCSNDELGELSPSAQRAQDSISKVKQRIKSDSLRRTNPLLIVPPDSLYTGDYTDKYSSGVVKFKGYFRFGERHGQWMSFYPTGILWSELHYDKGLRHGPNVTYFESGKKRYEGFYKDDQQDSLWVYYDTEGAVAEKVMYKNDKIVKRIPVGKNNKR
jgi:hypothetical protein